jgi:hypothetical protein
MGSSANGALAQFVGTSATFDQPVTRVQSAGTFAALYVDMNGNAQGVLVDHDDTGTNASIEIDRDGNNASTITGIKINVANAGAGAARGLWVEAGSSQFDGDITVGDAKIIILNTTTGTKIGTATTQKLGFFNATPVVQPSAYTQTYSTADKTHANFTSSDLTGITASTTGSALAEPGAAYSQSTLQQNFRRIQDQFVNLRGDVADLKQLVNSIIDDLQSLGLVG